MSQDLGAGMQFSPTNYTRKSKSTEWQDRVGISIVVKS